MRGLEKGRGLGALRVVDLLVGSKNQKQTFVGSASLFCDVSADSGYTGLAKAGRRVAGEAGRFWLGSWALGWRQSESSEWCFTENLRG